jgi:hypothetical protein
VSPNPTVLAVANSRNCGVWTDHAVLIEQGELALNFQHPLDHEHHVGTAGIVFVEGQAQPDAGSPKARMPFAKFGDLLPLLQNDCVFADRDRYG